MYLQVVYLCLLMKNGALEPLFRIIANVLNFFFPYLLLQGGSGEGGVSDSQLCVPRSLVLHKLIEDSK